MKKTKQRNAKFRQGKNQYLKNNTQARESSWVVSKVGGVWGRMRRRTKSKKKSAVSECERENATNERKRRKQNRKKKAKFLRNVACTSKNKTVEKTQNVMKEQQQKEEPNGRRRKVFIKKKQKRETTNVECVVNSDSKVAETRKTFSML